jgi:F-type H+-transporting ATPase subunit b
VNDSVTSYRTRLTLVFFSALLVLMSTPAHPLAALRDRLGAPGAPIVQAESAPGVPESVPQDTWKPTIAKVFNFLALMAILVYFLRTPLVTHLRTRGDQIRKDLVDAATLRVEGERRLTDVRSKLALLPGELDALRQRGQEELAAERVRMAETTTRERERVTERTRREIGLQFRLARRDLLHHVADVSMTLARRRVEREITPADQTRLVDRYATEVQS